MSEKQEALLGQILNLFAERFNTMAILRGGMVLRLLGCPRLTNDLDYVFVPFKSKRDIVDDVVATLRKIPGSEVTYSLNSKCLRAVVTVAGTSVQVEVKVALEEQTTILSTREVAGDLGLPTRLVRVVDYPVALANKMADWNERRLIRDLYDIWFYLKMGVRPDPTTLAGRLAKPEYSRLVKESERFQQTDTTRFLTFLSAAVQKLTDQHIAESLSDYLAPEEIPGLAMRFRAEIAKLVE